MLLKTHGQCPLGIERLQPGPKKKWNKKGWIWLPAVLMPVDSCVTTTCDTTIAPLNPFDRFDPGPDFAFSYKVQGSDKWVRGGPTLLTDPTPNVDQMLFGVTPKTFPK